MAVSRRFLLLSPLMPAVAILHPAFAAAAENTPDRTIERLYECGAAPRRSSAARFCCERLRSWA
jgi:hypothetical protein